MSLKKQIFSYLEFPFNIGEFVFVVFKMSVEI